ncbi:calcium-binding protein [Microvirga sp. CF3016]|uniref:calcium-binding protein n=1 Tax=Microvirga sp. CF3016 TaxID=3110181 RepID=UPI002E79037D|nr:calcium-binding protein [Microvirga sp. CF3016]MEE1611945.1 calcium-binding protein [Microvirga sp. CF3016]
MAEHDPISNTYTLLPTEEDFTLLPEHGDANVIGNDKNNRITGNAGVNSLDGGAGADTLRGGLGDDTYVVSDEGDRVFEDAGEGSGFDTAIASTSYTLEGNVEKLVLVGSATRGTGNALDNILTGNQNDNVLIGGDGNDTLMGGSAGVDTLHGGRGDDTYILDDDVDNVVEGAGEGSGFDTVISSVSNVLEANIEKLVLIGSATHGIGNDLDNVLEGNENDNFLSGGNGNDTLIGGSAGADTFQGGRGDDLYYFSSGNNVIEEEDTVEGGGNDTIVSSSTVDLANFPDIENLTLEGTADVDGLGNALDNTILGNDGQNILDGRNGNDSLVGGLGDDHLIGGDGNDTLDGGEGTDEFDGGIGDDTYIVDGDETIDEGVDEGNDTVIVTVGMDYSIAGTQIENVIMWFEGTVTGNDLANDFVGSDGNDVLNGDNGDDILNGGGGADGLIGGEGDDDYYVDTELDSITEQANQGDDKVFSTSSFDLSRQGANVEYLALIGSANLKATGNDLANTIIGNDGSNTLDGRGGNDTMEGGKGNDTYIIDAGDTIQEEEGEGRDTIQVGFNAYTLGSNIEDLTFTGTGNFTGAGNTLNNFIRSSTGNDTLVGGNGDDSLHGGAGADRMEGGVGSDLYWVDHAGDVIVDSGIGFDRVLASSHYTLGANLEYLAFEGGGNFAGTGNELDNTMYGNTGANTLDGGAGRDQLDGGEGADHLLGGAGDDTITDWKGDDVIDGGAGKDDLRGGVGNDSYVVDGLDLVTELAGQGLDTVTASESFALAAAAEVEVLIAKAGTSAINLTGSDTANTISGNDGANTLSGVGGDDVLTGLLGNDTLSGGIGNDRLAGGSGKDTLWGDLGADTIVFDTRILAANADKVMAYRAPEDRIFIENALLKANKVLYKAIGKGTEAKPAGLAKKFFTIGPKAKDKDDFFVLNTKKHTLSYDADGSGSKAAIVIATFDKDAMKKFTHKELFFI